MKFSSFKKDQLIMESWRSFIDEGNPSIPPTAFSELKHTITSGSDSVMRGHTGEVVGVIQKKLMDWGFLNRVKPDEIFGKITKAGVVAFQKAYNNFRYLDEYRVVELPTGVNIKSSNVSKILSSNQGALIILVIVSPIFKSS